MSQARPTSSGVTRAELRDQADMMGIETSGMTKKQMNSAIENRVSSNEKAKKESENSMKEFINIILAQKEAARTPNGLPAAAPDVGIDHSSQTPSKLDAAPTKQGSGSSHRNAAIPDPPSKGTVVWGAVEGVLQWIETEGCDE